MATYETTHSQEPIQTDKAARGTAPSQAHSIASRAIPEDAPQHYRHGAVRQRDGEPHEPERRRVHASGCGVHGVEDSAQHPGDYGDDASHGSHPLSMAGVCLFGTGQEVPMQNGTRAPHRRDRPGGTVVP